MRKQYHFRPSDQGILAWDIDRLVELSRNFRIEQVPLDQIRELDEEYWFGFESKPTCRVIADHITLVNQADLAYPIILDSGGRIYDGMHRVVKAFVAGHDTIDAVRFGSDPEPDHTGLGPDQLPT